MRLQVKDSSAPATLRQLLVDTGLCRESLARQTLFVVFCLHPIFVRKYGSYRVWYDGDSGDQVRTLASTYTQGTLPSIEAAPEAAPEDLECLWVRIGREGALFTKGKKRKTDRRGKDEWFLFKSLLRGPMGGWMLVPGMRGGISLASAVPHWTIQDTSPTGEWADAAIQDTPPTGEWADPAVPYSFPTEGMTDYARKWCRRVALNSEVSRVLIDPAPRQFGTCARKSCDLGRGKALDATLLCDVCRISRICTTCENEDDGKGHVWVCDQCAKSADPSKKFFLYQLGNKEWAYAKPLDVRDCTMYEFDGSQYFHDVAAFAPDVDKHRVRYSIVLQRDSTQTDALGLSFPSTATPVTVGEDLKRSLLEVLRDLPYQTWPAESRQADTVDYPSGWLNVMMGGKFRVAAGGKTLLDAHDQQVLHDAVQFLQGKSSLPHLPLSKVVVNAMSTAWPFTMGGHVDVPGRDQDKHVVATTMVLVDNPGRIVTLAGLRTNATSTIPASVHHYAKLITRDPNDTDEGRVLPRDPKDTEERCVLLRDPKDTEERCVRPGDKSRPSSFFQLVQAGDTLTAECAVLEPEQWGVLSRLLSPGCNAHVVVRIFIENGVRTASVSFLGGTSFPAHPRIRPCPLPNETNGKEEAERTKHGKEQATRNAYLQLLTNEAGLYAAETKDVPPKLRPYVRELARYQTNPLEVPIVSLRELDGGKRSFTDFVRQVWGAHPGCPFVLGESEHTTSTAGEIPRFFQGQIKAVFVSLSPPWGGAERSTIQVRLSGYDLTGVLSRANTQLFGPRQTHTQSICRVLRRGQSWWYRCSDREVTVESRGAEAPRFSFQEGETITGLVYRPTQR